MSRRMPTVIAAGITGLAVAVAWLAIATQPELPDYSRWQEGWSGDFRSYYLPNAAYAGSRIAEGELPLWNPHQGLGGPFLATVQVGALYPPNWLHAVLPSPRAFVVLAFLHLVVAALGAARLAGALGAGAWGAALSALLYAGSNNLVSSVYSPPLLYTAAWAPFLLYFVDRLVAEPTARRVAGLAAVESLMLLAGWPYTFAMTALCATLYGGALGTARAIRERRVPWRSLAALSIGVLAGAALAAPQLLPTQELLARSCRALGSVVERQAIFVDRPHDPARFWRQLRNTGYNDAIPGIAAVVLAALALLLPGARARVAALLGIAGLALLASFPNDWPVYGWLRELPLLGDFRFPYRYRFVTSLVLAVTAGVGVTQLARRLERRPPLARGVATLALAVCAATVTVPVLRNVPRFPRDVAPPADLETELAALGVAVEPGDGQRVYWEGRANKSGTDIGVDVVFDMEPLSLARTAEIVTFFETGRPRTLLSLPHELDSRNLRGDSVAAPYYGHVGVPMDGSRAEVLDWLSVRWIVTASPPRWLATRYPRRSRDGAELAVFENPTALPRAYRVAAALKAPPRLKAGLRGMLGEAFDPRRHVLLDDPPQALLRAAASGLVDPEATVAIDRYEPEHVVLQTDGGSSGVVVLTDAWFPGWQATLDGHPVPVLRANLGLRGVVVPAGTHTVEMRYRPASLRFGALAALVSAVGLATAVLRSRRRRPSEVAR